MFNRPMWATGCITVLALLLGSAGRVSAQQASSESVADGARVYGAVCGGCHNARSPLERSDRDWVTITNHMRVRANLTGDQVRTVLAFLQATNSDPSERVQLPEAQARVQEQPAVQEGAASTDPQVIAAGKALVEQKACLGCHVIGSAGGQVGPSLNSSVSRRGAMFVRQKTADPTFNNSTSMMPNFGLTPDQIEAIVAYLNTLNGN
jgi:mono/diheme cytochrome c family protein